MAWRRSKVQVKLIPSGDPNLDQVLGGGIPEYSINMVAGGPGSGKTTLVQQILFHDATPRLCWPSGSAIPTRSAASSTSSPP